MRRTGWWAVMAACAALSACNCNPAPKADGGTPSDAGGGNDAGLGNDAGPGNDGGGGLPSTLSPAANDATQFTSPFDATPSPDGTKIYFTAISGTDPGVFSATATGGNVTAITTAGPLVAPFGISIDNAGTMLCVADASGTGDASGADDGCIFSVMTTPGSTPMCMPTTEHYRPKGVDVIANDVCYFTGVDPANGMPGLFKTTTTGGAVTVVAEGAPFVDPSGVAVTASGDAYVADTIGSAGGSAGIIHVTPAGAASAYINTLAVGYPAGVALSADERTLLVSALDPATKTDLVIFVNLTTSVQTNFTTGISAFGESAGLHRARNTGVFAWADSQANNGGTVYVLK